MEVQFKTEEKYVNFIFLKTFYTSHSDKTLTELLKYERYNFIGTEFQIRKISYENEKRNCNSESLKLTVTVQFSLIIVDEDSLVKIE